MGSIGAPELLVLGFSCVFVVPWLYALIDALKIPADVWKRADQNQLVWILVILLGGFFGAILYFVIPRRALKAASI